MRRSHFSSIDQCLGPANARFFGDGFKRVDQRLSRLVITDRPGLGAVSAKAALSYPADWSRKSSGNPPAHLSSIDAVVLTVELVDAYLTHGYKLGPHQRGRSELLSYAMRVGRPQADLSCFDAVAVCSSCEPLCERTGRCRSTFDCTIGTVRITCAIDHDTNPLRIAPASYETPFDVFSAPARYYHEGYKQRTHHIEDLVVDHRRQRVAAVTTVTAARRDVGDIAGFGSARQPCVSPIDCLVVLAQLAQVLTYELDGLARATSNTLWMRRLAMQASRSPQPLDTPLAGVVEVARSGLLSMGEHRWRTLELIGQLMGVRIDAAVAHQLPDVDQSLVAMAGDAEPRRATRNGHPA